MPTFTDMNDAAALRLAYIQIAQLKDALSEVEGRSDWFPVSSLFVPPSISRLRMLKTRIFQFSNLSNCLISDGLESSAEKWTVTNDCKSFGEFCFCKG